VYARELHANPSLSWSESLAEDFVNAFNAGDADASQRIQEHYELSRPLTTEELQERTARRLRRLISSQARAAGGRSWVDRRISSIRLSPTAWAHEHQRHANPGLRRLALGYMLPPAPRAEMSKLQPSTQRVALDLNLCLRSAVPTSAQTC